MLRVELNRLAKNLGAPLELALLTMRAPEQEKRIDIARLARKHLFIPGHCRGEIAARIESDGFFKRLIHRQILSRKARVL